MQSCLSEGRGIIDISVMRGRSETKHSRGLVRVVLYPRIPGSRVRKALDEPSLIRMEGIFVDPLRVHSL